MADTTIKVRTEVRDALKTAAEAAGKTMGELLADMASVVTDDREQPVAWLLEPDTLRLNPIIVSADADPIHEVTEAVRRHIAWRDMAKAFAKQGIPIPDDEEVARTQERLANLRQGITPDMRRAAGRMWDHAENMEADT